MIIFHEGLPGSGKSFEAMTNRIIPALKEGRKVCAYMEGLNVARIAECAEMTEAEVNALLQQVKREDVLRMWELAPNDSLVVIDELQNFWPVKGGQISPEVTQWVAEHRHKGQDIVAMGQSMKDCNALWKRRISQLVRFQSREAIGQPDKYNWIVLKATAPEQFKETTKGSGRYDPKFFGTYASHEADTDNKTTYKDAKAVVWNNPFFKKWLPLYGVALLAAIGFIVWFFQSGGGMVNKSEPPAKQASAEKHGPTIPNAKREALANPAPPPAPVPLAAAPRGPTPEIMPADWLAERIRDNRLRLVGSMRKASGGSVGIVEIRAQEGSRLLERFTFRELAGLGWVVLASPDTAFAELRKGQYKFIASSWPLEDDRGRVSEVDNARIAGDGSQAPFIADQNLNVQSAPLPVAPPAREGGGVSQTAPKLASR